MKVIAFDTFLQQQDFFIQEARAGKIFIYPTDTIYGIGGIISEEVVEIITKAKLRTPWKHYSIIAPSYQRVEKHFEVKDFEKYRFKQKSDIIQWRWLTVLCPLQTEYMDSLWVVSSNHLIWVRFLDHALQTFVENLWEWFITTSANISWNAVIKTLDDIHISQKQYIDYFINYWAIDWIPSKIIKYETWAVVRD